MSYTSDWDFGAHGPDEKSNRLINRIIEYIGEIWGLNSFDDDWDTACMIEECVKHKDYPCMQFIGSNDENEYLEQFHYYDSVGEGELFDLLNALFPRVYLSGHWNGWDSVGGNKYFYEIEYDSGKMCYFERYGMNGRERKERQRLDFEAPSEPLVKILATKAADERETELTAILLDLLNKIHLRLIPNEQQKEWNQKSAKLKFQRQRSSLRSSIRKSKALSPVMRDALLEYSKTCNAEDDLVGLREKFSCACEMNSFRYFNDDESAALLKALMEANTKEALESVHSLYDSLRGPYYIQEQCSALRSNIQKNAALLPIMRDALLDLSNICDTEDELFRLQQKYAYACKMNWCRYFSDDENTSLLNALIKAETKEALESVQLSYDLIRKAYYKRQEAEDKKRNTEWELEWFKKRLAEQIKPLEKQIEQLQNELKQYEDISLVSTTVLTNHGEGIITKQEGAKIWVTAGTKTILYLLHKDCPNRPHFKDDEQIVNLLSKKHYLCTTLNHLQYRLSILKKPLEKLNRYS